LKPSVYSLKDLAGIIRKNKFDVLQILTELNGEDSLPLVYETKKTCDLSYAGTLFIAKQKGIKAEVVLVQKTSARFVPVARAQNPITKVTQFGAASYPITVRFEDSVIRYIVGRLATRNAIEKVLPRQEVLVFMYQARLSDNDPYVRRVAKRCCHRSAPIEPYVKLSLHTALTTIKMVMGVISFLL
jgi:hypothetical protein